MNKRVNAILIERPLVAVFVGAAAVLALVHCGGGSSSSGPTNTTPPTTQPTTPIGTPTPTAGFCSPTPPPLYGIHIKIHDDSGYRKTLDSRPQVVNSYDTTPSYCVLAEQGNGPFCWTRTEGGDQQMFACDSMAVGRAADTGRYGPTWYYNGLPCTAVGDSAAGCKNHPTNQFLVIAKGPGEYAACAAADVPVAASGSRCGTFVIN